MRSYVCGTTGRVMDCAGNVVVVAIRGDPSGMEAASFVPALRPLLSPPAGNVES
jgi:hypothetical protein